MSVGLFGESDDVVAAQSCRAVHDRRIRRGHGYANPYTERLDGAGLLDRFDASGREGRTGAPRTAEGHIVIVGMSSMGRSIARSLAERGERVVAIDTDPHKLAGLPVEKRRRYLVHGHPGRRRARTRQRRRSALKIDEANRLFVHRCQSLGVPVVVHGFDRSVLDGLERLGPAYLINSRPRQTSVSN